MARPLKFNSPTILRNKCNRYFKKCDKNSLPYTITGLALALHTSRKTLLELENQEHPEATGEFTQEYATVVKEAKLRCQNYAEKFLFCGKNVVGAIFNLKNNYGWNDANQTDLRVINISKLLDNLEKDDRPTLKQQIVEVKPSLQNKGQEPQLSPVSSEQSPVGLPVEKVEQEHNTKV